MDIMIETEYDGHAGTLYFSNDGDEYSCHFTVDNEEADVLFHADTDSFDSFDEFRVDVESNFPPDVTSILFS